MREVRPDISRRCFLAAAFAAVAVDRPRSAARACDGCGFFERSTHRTGSYAVQIVIDRSTYRAGTIPLLTVTLVNAGRTVLYVGTNESLPHQTAYHINRPGVGGTSEFDKPIRGRGRNAVLPGQRLGFAAMPLTRWGVDVRAPGFYQFALSYGQVDSNIVTFIIA
jgi:hypothetical protein